jgi:hypothetical protein
MKDLDTRIIKGGALLYDTRRFLEAWDQKLGPEENLDRLRRSGALGKRSGKRSADVLAVLRQRFVEPDGTVIATLRLLLGDPRAFREACYYEAARAHALLAAFVEEALFAWQQAGRTQVTVADAVAWLGSGDRTPSWTEPTRLRVAQGLFSALRDFGLLEGAVRKRIAPPRLSMRGFAYVAVRERDQHRSGRSLLQAAVWRRYLLAPEHVRALFLEADRLKVLRFAEAGTAIRIDWLIANLEEVPRVVAA